MNKIRLLPKMAVNSILRNKVVYLPYILTMALAVAVYYTFSCIIGNKMLENVPYAFYMLMLLKVGRALLAIILVPFLFYTNSFLIKRRKKELGLYTVLGLEKKHVGLMMIVETLCMYVIAVATGLIVSIAFSKFIFLILVNAAGMPKDAVFTMDMGSFVSTLVLFGVISMMNLFTNLWQVTMTNPTELLRSGQKGEKEPKNLRRYTLIGILVLGSGYVIALCTQMNSLIFLLFFLAIFLVIIGSYYLFTSGSIALLQRLKKSKNYYYKKEHFVTVAGMLYRMKRNASSLVNICIFSTMIMITLICTLTLIISKGDIIQFDSPYHGEYIFHDEGDFRIDEFQELCTELAKQNDVEITEEIAYQYGLFTTIVEDHLFKPDLENGLQDDEMTVVVMTLDVFNQIEGTTETLKSDEVLFFATAKDYAYQDVIRDQQTYWIKKQLSSIRVDTKEPHTYSNRKFFMIVPDEATQTRLCGEARMFRVLLNVSGQEENGNGFHNFLSELDTISREMPNYSYAQNVIDRTGMMEAMTGGLLFIGVFFGLIFTIFLVLIMYYKQIAEGMEDCDSFHIMQNVGMSRDNVRATIKSQILLIFGLPLLAAMIHTCFGLPLTIKLMYTLNIYNTANIILSTVVIMIIFAVFYGASYLLTAKTYYKLVIK